MQDLIGNAEVFSANEIRLTLPKEVIEKFSIAPNGKPFFSEFKKDLHRNYEDIVNPSDAQKRQVVKIEDGIDNIMGEHAYLRVLIDDYDDKLHNVIKRHENDFLSAYRTHMTKVMKQLQLLKDKAIDQENKLNNDERIVRMEKNLEWYRHELSTLAEVKDKNENEIDRITAFSENLKEEKRYKEE